MSRAAADWLAVISKLRAVTPGDIARAARMDEMAWRVDVTLMAGDTLMAVRHV